MYHSFSANTDTTYDNVTMHIDLFERQLQHLVAHYQIVPLREIIRSLKTGESLGERTTALTFDDGYRSNFTLAYPLLVRYKAHATIFLTTDLIGTNRSVWVNELHYALVSTNKRTLSLTMNHQQVRYVLDQEKSRQLAYEEIKRQLKNLSTNELHYCLNSIYAQLETDFSFMKITNYEMLSWDEIESMDRQFVEFGCHTASHPVLTTIRDEDELIREIVEPKQKMAKISHCENPIFCYPDGAFDKRIKSFVQENYFGAVSTFCGSTNRTSDPYTLPRIGGGGSYDAFLWNLLRY